MSSNTGEHNPFTDKKAVVLVVSHSQELAERLVGEIFDPLLEGGLGLRINGIRIEIASLTGNPADVSDWEQQVQSAHAVIIPIEHADTLSIEEIKPIYEGLTRLNLATPLAFFIIREANKREFKVSCLKCGQKIMLRDEYVGRACACPNCKKPFTIVSQKMALRQQLHLSLNVQVEQVDSTSRDLSRSALERLIEHSTPVPSVVPMTNEQALKHSTMRINIGDLNDL